MICKLCLGANENSIDIASDEGIQLNISSILNKYFPFCFQDKINQGLVCRKCWWKVEIFHEFYMHIESIHNSSYENESIFVSGIDEHLKISLETEDESMTEEGKGIKNEFVQAEYLRDNLNSDGKTNKVGVSRRNPKSKNTIAKSTSKGKPNSVYQKNKQVCDKYKCESNQKTASKMFQCDSCNLLFLSQHKLYVHIKKDHTALQFKCSAPKCYESFASQELLDQHSDKVHIRIECPHCQKKLAPYYLAEHIKQNHDERQRVFCDICGIISANIRAHKNHITLVHDVQEKVQCDICKAWLANKSSIRTHMTIQHIQVPETCPICGKTSPNRNALIKHKKCHFPETRERYKCTVCHRGFRDNTNLKQHIHIHSSISHIYPCNFCDKSFRFPRSLQNHIKKEHSMEVENFL